METDLQSNKKSRTPCTISSPMILSIFQLFNFFQFCICYMYLFDVYNLYFPDGQLNTHFFFMFTGMWVFTSVNCLSYLLPMSFFFVFSLVDIVYICWILIFFWQRFWSFFSMMDPKFLKQSLVDVQEYFLNEWIAVFSSYHLQLALYVFLKKSLLTLMPHRYLLIFSSKCLTSYIFFAQGSYFISCMAL